MGDKLPSSDDESWEEIKASCSAPVCLHDRVRRREQRWAMPSPRPPTPIELPPPVVTTHFSKCTHRALNPVSSDSDDSNEDPELVELSLRTHPSDGLPKEVESDDEEGPEEVFAIQVPNDVAARFNHLLRDSPYSPAGVQVQFDEPTKGQPQGARLTLDGETLPARLCRLPTVVEVHKSFDPGSGVFHKANQIGQMLVVDRNPAALPKKVELPHGLSPPTAHIRKHKWTRRSQKLMERRGGYTKAQMAEVENELGEYAKNKKAPKPIKEIVWEDVYEGDSDA
jgi:TATA-binding protein-associated factor Taf7